MRGIFTDPRANAAIELGTMGLIAILMILDDAPAWAIVLAFYVGTRASRSGVASDLGSVQKSIGAADANVDRVHDLIDKLSRK